MEPKEMNLLLTFGIILIVSILTYNLLVIIAPTAPFQTAVQVTPETTTPSVTNGDKDMTKEYDTPEPITEGIKTTADGRKYLVDPSKLLTGAAKDGIPAIDNPKFTTVQNAASYVQDGERVLGLLYKGKAKAYPTHILDWHEIVNETIEGDPISITYCPLCGSGLAFIALVDGKPTTMGVSGKLYNSGLVMYDRLTNSYWEQITGTAIVGSATGQKLAQIPLDVSTWGRWKELHPDTEVLTRETGFTRPYGNYPYGNYETDSGLIFPKALVLQNIDERYHDKTWVHGLELNGQYKAYLEEELVKAGGRVEEEFAGQTVVIVQDAKAPSSVKAFLGSEDGKELVLIRNFWFSWYAFHPTTEVFEAS